MIEVYFDSALDKEATVLGADPLSAFRTDSDAQVDYVALVVTEVPLQTLWP